MLLECLDIRISVALQILQTRLQSFLQYPLLDIYRVKHSHHHRLFTIQNALLMHHTLEVAATLDPLVYLHVSRLRLTTSLSLWYHDTILRDCQVDGSGQLFVLMLQRVLLRSSYFVQCLFFILIFFLILLLVL